MSSTERTNYARTFDIIMSLVLEDSFIDDASGDVSCSFVKYKTK
jgi:hypothetical protein